ncbi:hypothetical protein ACH5RR_026653 [Cinchona calisaya]|uniref:Ycf1 n=1 Tax=Cinchona calisaya TaxID=153742 RepID=A0ABD2Z369_9GENT
MYAADKESFNITFWYYLLGSSFDKGYKRGYLWAVRTLIVDKLIGLSSQVGLLMKNTTEKRSNIKLNLLEGEQFQQQDDEFNNENKEGFNSVNDTTKNWNEPIQDDKELLQKQRFDAELEEYLDFNPEVEFKKQSFELKVGHKFKNFKVFREVLQE